MREKFGASALFGREKDDSLHSSLNAILQTFDGQDVYASLEEKAAHLLDFLVKNHSFVDGNKRIAAALFLWFMQKNALLRRDDDRKRIAENALVVYHPPDRGQRPGREACDCRPGREYDQQQELTTF